MKADKELDEIIIRLIDCAKHEDRLDQHFNDRCITKMQAKTALLAWRDKAVLAARIDEIDRIAIATDNGDLRDGVRAATYLTERGDYLNQLNKATMVGIDFAYPDKDGAKDEHR